MNKIFSDIAWKQYTSWLDEDRKILKRINDLIKDIERNGNKGIGKPEPLRYELSSYWSRRIDSSNRLIYRINNNQIEVIQCKGHYE